MTDTAPDVEQRGLKLETQARSLARVLREVIPAGTGFTLFLFEHEQGTTEVGDGSAMTYISSAKRRDMLSVLEQFMDRPENVTAAAALKGQPPPQVISDLEAGLPPLDREDPMFEFRLVQRAMRALIAELTRHGVEGEPEILVSTAAALVSSVVALMAVELTTEHVEHVVHVLKRGVYMFLEHLYEINITPDGFKISDEDLAEAEATAPTAPEGVAGV